MFGTIALIGAMCVACVSAEAPFNSRYNSQRLRQAPHFQRQQAAPYSPAGNRPDIPFNLPNNPQVDTQYGPPTTPPGPAYGAPPVPTSQYGAPPLSNDETELTSNETGDNPDSEIIANGRLTRFEKLRQAQRLSGRNRQKFQRLELQPEQPLSQTLQPLRPQAQLFQRVELAPAPQQGTYFIQLPNGSVQQVTYLAQPSVIDNSISARLQFRPVVETQATAVAEQPQIYVNTLVQAYTNPSQN